MPRKPREPADKPSAYDKALGLLARREHSRRELKTKLAVRGYSGSDAESAVADLQTERAQSDDRYAEALIRHRIAAGYGPRYIESELKSHGIAPAAFRSMLDAPDWLEIALALTRKRCPAHADRATRARTAQYLQRRGFPTGVIAATTGRKSE